MKMGCLWATFLLFYGLKTHIKMGHLVCNWSIGPSWFEVGSVALSSTNVLWQAIAFILQDSKY